MFSPRISFCSRGGPTSPQWTGIQSTFFTVQNWWFPSVSLSKAHDHRWWLVCRKISKLKALTLGSAPTLTTTFCYDAHITADTAIICLSNTNPTLHFELTHSNSVTEGSNSPPTWREHPSLSSKGIIVLFMNIDKYLNVQYHFRFCVAVWKRLKWDILRHLLWVSSSVLTNLGTCFCIVVIPTIDCVLCVCHQGCVIHFVQLVGQHSCLLPRPDVTALWTLAH